MQLVQEVRDGLRGAIEIPRVSALVEIALVGGVVGGAMAVLTKRKGKLPTAILGGAAAGMLAQYWMMHVLKPSLHPELIMNPNPSLLPHGGA